MPTPAGSTGKPCRAPASWWLMTAPGQVRTTANASCQGPTVALPGGQRASGDYLPTTGIEPTTHLPRSPPLVVRLLPGEGPALVHRLEGHVRRVHRASLGHATAPMCHRSRSVDRQELRPVVGLTRWWSDEPRRTASRPARRPARRAAGEPAGEVPTSDDLDRLGVALVGQLVGEDHDDAGARRPGTPRRPSAAGSRARPRAGSYGRRARADPRPERRWR